MSADTSKMQAAAIRELCKPLHDHVLRRALAAARRIAQTRFPFHRRH